MRHCPLLFILFVVCGALLPMDCGALPLTERAQEIGRLEAELKRLGQADVEAFLSQCPCFLESPLRGAVPLYQAAAADEKRFVAAGIGENHPLLKAARRDKRLAADKISKIIEEAREHIASRLTELRKESPREK